MGRYAERFSDQESADARYEALRVELKAARVRDLMMIQATVDDSWYVLVMGSNLDTLRVSPPIGVRDLDVPEEIWQMVEERRDGLRMLYPHGPVSITHAEPELVRVPRRSH